MVFQNYLIVDCFYTSRLVEHIETMDPKPLLISDCMYGDGLTRLDATNEDIDILENCTGYDDDGTIVFASNDDLKAVEIIKMLQTYHHCGFFYIDSYYGLYPEGNHSQLREIVDEDLDNFVKDGDEYYHGTLYQVDIKELPNCKIMTLHFDTESG